MHVSYTLYTIFVETNREFWSTLLQMFFFYKKKVMPNIVLISRLAPPGAYGTWHQEVGVSYGRLSMYPFGLGMSH